MWGPPRCRNSRAAIGEYVGELFAALLAGDPNANACSHAAAASEAAAVGVTEAASKPVALPRPPRVCNSAVPPLGVLAADYAKRSDGTVIVWVCKGGCHVAA